MMSEVFAVMLRANLVAAAAVLLVLLLRRPARGLFGPEIAYGLWAAPPLAALATLLPARTVDGAARHDLAIAVADISGIGLLIWGMGVMIAGLILIRAQLRFLAEARRGASGPSVVGVISPRILMPADDGAFTAEERALIRAHEREHIVRQDPRANALAAVMQALGWLNPLLHIGAHVMRLDQELACDAAVLKRRPRARCLYARTLLKTQLTTQALPFGCHWPARTVHPLEVRISLLRSSQAYQGLTGPLMISAVLITCAFTAWSAQPPVPRQPLPILALWEQQQGPHMSVMLLTWPAREPRG